MSVSANQIIRASLAAQYGGFYSENEVLKKIISIGYEFETHDLAKLSLSENERDLINSGITTRELKAHTKYDDNYYVIEAYLGEQASHTRTFFESNESSSAATTVNKEDMDFDTEYLEYITEPRPGDGNDTVVQITNDLATTSFTNMLQKKCGGRTEQMKNDLYVFRTHGGRNYNIKFDTTLLERGCGALSGLEIVITFYKPQRTSNILMDTFAEACQRIVDHLSGLEVQRGDLFLANKNKAGFTAIGSMPFRKLYHKPGTNLHYLETGDWKGKNTHMLLKSIHFTPQMTFSCHITDLFPIGMYLYGTNKKHRKAIQYRRNNETDVHELEWLMDNVSALIDGYNDKAEMKGLKPIDLGTKYGETIFWYLFFFYMKLTAYILDYEKENEDASVHRDKALETSDYLKNYLGLMVRHTNYDLYTRMKYHTKKEFGYTEDQAIHMMLTLLYQKEILSVMYDDDECITKKLPKSDKKYGDPQVSISSYFRFFEEPTPNDKGPDDSTVHDWLLYSEIEVSTLYPLSSDNLIVEFRSFNNSGQYSFPNEFGITKKYSGAMSLDYMLSVINKIKGTPIKQLESSLYDKEYNPNTGRMVKKCAPGKIRNEKFRCVSANPKRKPTATRTIRKKKDT